MKIWNRDASDYLEIKEGATSFFPGMTCIKVVDLETGEPRESTREDIATIARVADALPNIDGVCVPVIDVPRPTLHGEIGGFVAMAENTTKPLEYLCDNSIAFDAVIEMAAAIRGGMDRLAEKPYFTHQITPLPLYYAKTHSDQIIRAAECGIPAMVGTVSIGGGTAPYTIAGCMTHSLATDFAGMVLSQLVREGSFCIGCAGKRLHGTQHGEPEEQGPGTVGRHGHAPGQESLWTAPDRRRWWKFFCTTFQPGCMHTDWNRVDGSILPAAGHVGLPGHTK